MSDCHVGDFSGLFLLTLSTSVRHCEDCAVQSRFKDQQHKRGILADDPAPHFTAFELDTNEGRVWIVSIAPVLV